MNLADQIYKLRTAQNLSQNDLADLLDVSRQSVSKWETGASVPELDKIIRMSELFHVSLDTLVHGCDCSAPAAKEIQQNDLQPSSVALPDSSLRRIIGIILCCFGGAALLLFGPVGGLLFALPLFTVGILCINLRHPLLWCCWGILLYAHFVLPYMMGIRIGLAPLISQISGGVLISVQSVIGFAFLLFQYAAIALTVKRFYKTPVSHCKAKIAAALVMCVLLRTLPYILYYAAPHFDGLQVSAALITVCWDLANTAALTFFLLYLVHFIFEQKNRGAS